MNDHPTRQQAEEEISDELVKIHEESYGAGASNVESHVLEDSVLVILDVEVTEAERTLMTAGKGEAVRRSREDFQEAVGPTFIAVVERATGRRVTSWVSRMSIDPVYSVEVFRLAPS
jgi:uncharacterized protein YbcI